MSELKTGDRVRIAHTDITGYVVGIDRQRTRALVTDYGIIDIERLELEPREEQP